MTTLEHLSETISDRHAGLMETGSFAPSDKAATKKSTLVIATYNIRYAVGSFLITGSIGRRLGLKMPARRPRLIAKHLAQAATALSDGRLLPAPQILALQESDYQTVRAGGRNIARDLARSLSMNYVYAAPDRASDEEPKSKQWYLDFEEHLLPSEKGKSGIAVLSRLPFSSVERIELPWRECAWRPRLALWATIQNGDQSLHLFNSHIDPHASVDEQLEQHAFILSRADELKGTTILLGDFNTLSKRSSQAMREFLEAHGFMTPFPTGTATWRAGLIRLHTDWIFLRGARVKRFDVARGLRVSDHWPVWCEIELNDSANESVERIP